MSPSFSAHRRPLLLVVAFLLGLLVVGLLLGEQRVSSAADTALDLTVDPSPGRYLDDIRLQMQVPHPGATIYYTLDGRAPDPLTGQAYSTPMSLSADSPRLVPLRARAFLPDGTAGPLWSGSYLLGLETDLPVLSLIVDPADLWDEEVGIYVNHEGRGRAWERPVDLTMIRADGTTAFDLGAGLRIHGEWTRWFFDKKSLRLYFREQYGARKLAYPIFGPNGQTEFDVLYLHNSDQDLLLFRNLLVDRLAAGMGDYASRSRPALLFINGEPWGIYSVRERIDERFLEEAYGVPEAAVADTPNIPSRQSAAQRAEDLPHWEAFVAFVEQADLTDPAQYGFLQTQIDVDNFIDYFLLQMYIANTDWPHHNVEQFRPWTQGGRWSFVPWDNDLAFERVDRQMVEHVLTAVHPLGVRMETLLNKLLANPDFRNQFLTRAADLLNTSLSTPVVTAEVEALLGALATDVPLEQVRWNVPDAWTDTADHMRDFAERRPEIMRQHFVESFDLTGTALIQFAAGEPPGGEVVVNDSPPQALPWQGIYFRDTEIRLRVQPPVGYGFAGWEGLPPGATEDRFETRVPVVDDLLLTPHFQPLTADQPRPGDVRITAVRPNDGDVGDWIELEVMRPQGVDLRGWQLTDKDRLDSKDEGALILSDDPLLADLPVGTLVRIWATRSADNDERFAADGWHDGMLQLYAGNAALDSGGDGWFNLGPKDNVLLLAPGGDGDIPIDLWSSSPAVSRADFGLPAVD